jgi:hypothetical protein
MEASLKGHTATVKLLLGAGAGTEAKNKVRERMKEIAHTHLYTWLTRWFEEGSTVRPLSPSLELRLVPHVAWGLA